MVPQSAKPTAVKAELNGIFKQIMVLGKKDLEVEKNLRVLVVVDQEKKRLMGRVEDIKK